MSACSVDDDDETIATTCGKAIADVEIAIVDEKGGQVHGTDGSVLVRGYNVMKGYLDDPEATTETIRDGWLDTGDRGRLDERGNLTITGRTKEMFVVGGFNVYPAEVEDVLAQHDAVAESGVIGVPDKRMGEVGRAYVRLRPGRQATRTNSSRTAGSASRTSRSPGGRLRGRPPEDRVRQGPPRGAQEQR